MTSEDLDPGRSEGELGPEDEETVRRLLAAAAGPLPMPEDVAGRLNAVLAELRAERGPDRVEGPGRSATVTDLSERRARRWPKVLVAAAAVSVIGVGLGSVVQNGPGDSMSATTLEEASDADAGAAADGAEVAPSPGSAEGLAPSDSTGEESVLRKSASVLVGASTPTAALPRVRPGSVAVDAQRIHDLTLRGPGSAPRGGPALGIDARACDLPAVTRGEELVAVRLDGQRATLLFRPDADGQRVAEVYSCDDGDLPVLLSTVDVR